MEQTRKNLTDFFKNSDFGEELLTSYLNYLVFNNFVKYYCKSQMISEPIFIIEFNYQNLKSIEKATDDELNKFKEYLFNVYKYNDFKDDRRELINRSFCKKFYNRSYTEEYLKTKFYSHEKLTSFFIRDLIYDLNNYFFEEDEDHPKEYYQEQVDKEVRENPEFLKLVNYYNRFNIRPENFQAYNFDYLSAVRFMAYNIAEDFFTKYPQELKELEK